MNTKSRKINLTFSMFTVGFWTFGSRIFGFLRDIMMASFLGSGVVAEAFLIAFTLPNMFRRFFGRRPPNRLRSSFPGPNTRNSSFFKLLIYLF